MSGDGTLRIFDLLGGGPAGGAAKRKGSRKRGGRIGYQPRAPTAGACAPRSRSGSSAIKMGRYRIVVTATDAAGNASQPKTKGFRIVG